MTIINKSRRRFLQNSMLAGCGVYTLGAVSPLIRFAEAVEGEAQEGIVKDRYYIFCYFGGGWDILLSLDPRDPTKFTTDNIKDTRILTGYEKLNPSVPEPLIYTDYGMFGPFIGDLASPKHANKIAVVRGMNMETLSHSSGRRRFITGKPPSGIQARGSAAATWFASKLGANNIVPNLVSGVETFNADQPTYASGIRANSVSDLLRTLRPAKPELAPSVQNQIEELLAQAAACPRGQQSKLHQIAEQSRLKSVQMATGKLDKQFDFLANSPEMQAVRAHYGIAKNAGGMGSPEGRAAMAAKAIMTGVSRCVSITVAGGLDSHGDEWASQHGPRQKRGFNAIARLIEDLEKTEYKGTGKSWMDHTNIITFSEFSRTPMLNLNGGRDHWLGNSSLVVGADFKGGQIIGASSNVGMQPQAVNLKTGQVDLNEGESLRPESIIQTMMHAVGIKDDPADFRCDPIEALLKS